MEEKEKLERILRSALAIMNIPGWSGTMEEALAQVDRQYRTMDKIFKEIDPVLRSELEEETKRRKNGG